MYNQNYPFRLPPLPYDYSALEPYIDTKTMQLHHDKHLLTYINNLNNALADYPEYQSWTLERLILNSAFMPPAIRTAVKNNAGGVFNHIFYFNGMRPGNGGIPDGEFSDKLIRTFGGLDAFQNKFKQETLSVFGSGYAWLVRDAAKNLKIITTANQETTLTRQLYPLLCADVWEHAYYLKHYNVRADYFDDWYHVANFDAASKMYAV